MREVSLTAPFILVLWKMVLYSYYIRDSGSTASSAIVGSALTTFHGWAYKHYFKIVSEDAKNLRVHCNLCGGSKTLSSARNSTSNFKKHLNTVHKSVKLVAREVEKPEKKRRRSVDTDDSELKRQCTLTRNSIPAQKMRCLLSKYVIEDMQPLSTVESPAFRKLINNICTTQILDRKSLLNTSTKFMTQCLVK